MRVYEGSKGPWHIGQRVTWADSNMRGTVFGLQLDFDGMLSWVGVKCDRPDLHLWVRDLVWEEPENIRPLNALELLSEIPAAS